VVAFPQGSEATVLLSAASQWRAQPNFSQLAVDSLGRISLSRTSCCLASPNPAMRSSARSGRSSTALRSEGAPAWSFEISDRSVVIRPSTRPRILRNAGSEFRIPLLPRNPARLFDDEAAFVSRRCSLSDYGTFRITSAVAELRLGYDAARAEITSSGNVPPAVCLNGG